MAESSILLSKYGTKFFRDVSSWNIFLSRSQIWQLLTAKCRSQEVSWIQNLKMYLDWGFKYFGYSLSYARIHETLARTGSLIKIISVSRRPIGWRLVHWTAHNLAPLRPPRQKRKENVIKNWDVPTLLLQTTITEKTKTTWLTYV